jgi:hypothetical protein
MMVQHRSGLRRHSGSGETVWLARLIDELERTSHADFCAVPCDAAVLAALEAQLARPPQPFCGRGPQVALLN